MGLGTVEEGKIMDDFPTPRLLREANQRYAEQRNPVPVDEEGNLLPFPAILTKNELVASVDFSSIDEHAVQTPVQFHRESTPVLVKYLCSKAKSELDKVRVIWRWIAAQDISKLQPGNHANMVLQSLLKIAAAVDAYSQLFVDMCRAANLQAEVIRGVKKYDDFNPNAPPAKTQSWSAVVIDKQWRLCDARWSSGFFTYGHEGYKLVDTDIKSSKMAPSGKWKMRLNDTYFLTPPEQLIYTHFPMLDEKWQLLARPVKHTEFCTMVRLGLGFFQLEAELLGHKQAVIKSEDGVEEIQLVLPHQKKRKNKFNYQLWRSASDTSNAIQLGRYVLMSHKKGQKLSTKITFPIHGTYKFQLMVYSGDTEEAYHPVCEYLIDCPATGHKVQPLPENPRMEWGPGADMESIGLEPVSHKEAVIETIDGIAAIDLTTGDRLELRPELHSNKFSTKELEKYILQQDDGSNVNFVVKVPTPDQYAFQLYAKTNENGEESFSNVCCYLVEGDKTTNDSLPFPDIATGKLGSTDKGKEVGIKCRSHPSSYIKAPNNGSVDIALVTEAKLPLDGILKSTKKGVDISRQMFLNNEDDTTHVLIRFPAVGSYSLHVNGAGGQDNLHNFVIDVDEPSEIQSPFPRMFPEYSFRKVTLIKPTTGVLPPREVVEFALRIPGAEKAAVKVGKKWVQLKQTDDGVWSGEATTGNGGSHVIVTTSAGNDVYNFLLRYDVVSQGEYDMALVPQESRNSKRAAKDKEKRRYHDMESSKKILCEATINENTKALVRILHYITENDYVTSMQEEVDEASALLKRLQR